MPPGSAPRALGALVRLPGRRRPPGVDDYVGAFNAELAKVCRDSAGRLLGLGAGDTARSRRRAASRWRRLAAIGVGARRRGAAAAWAHLLRRRSRCVTCLRTRASRATLAVLRALRCSCRGRSGRRTTWPQPHRQSGRNGHRRGVAGTGRSARGTALAADLHAGRRRLRARAGGPLATRLVSSAPTCAVGRPARRREGFAGLWFDGLASYHGPALDLLRAHADPSDI